MGQRKMNDSQRQQSALIPQTNIPNSELSYQFVAVEDSPCSPIPASSDLYLALIEWAEGSKTNLK